MKISYLPVLLSLFIFTTASKKSFGQCQTQGLPFIEHFDTIPTCKFVNPGVNTVVYYNGKAEFSGKPNTTTGSQRYTLVSDTILIDTNAMLTMKWKRRGTSGYYTFDSLFVRAKEVGTQNWYSIFNLRGIYLLSHKDNYSFVSYEFDRNVLDTALVGKNIILRIDFYGSTGSQAGTFYLDWIKLERIPSDNIKSVPFTESFNSSAWNNSSFSSGPLVNGWEALPQYPNQINYRWATDAGRPAISTTGPSSGVGGSGRYLYSYSSPGKKTSVFSPMVIISTLNQPELSFSYHMYGAHIDRLNIDVFDGYQWQKFDSIVGEQQFATTDAWKLYRRYLDTSQIVQVRFVAHEIENNTTSFSSAQISIDQVSIKEGDPCKYINPYSISLIQRGVNFLNLDWESTGASRYLVQYDTAGFTLGNGTVDTAQNNNYYLNGLASNSYYDIYILSECNGSFGDSVWIGPYTTNTECTPFVAPYLESFNDTLLSDCWQLYNSRGWVTSKQNNWVSTSILHPNNTALFMNHSSSNSWAYAVSGSVFKEVVVTMETPLIDVSNLITPELSFWIFRLASTSFPPPVIDHYPLYVDVFDGLHWQDSVLVHINDSSHWQHVTLDLSQFTIVDPVKIRFSVYKEKKATYVNRTVYIDDISVDNKPGYACTPADSLAVTQGCERVWISWVSDSSAISTQSIIYGLSGFDPQNGGVEISNPNNPQKISSLTTGAAYDVYVVDSCGTGRGTAKFTFTLIATPSPGVVYSYQHTGFNAAKVKYKFDASNSINGDSYYWDFGNGLTSTQAVTSKLFDNNKQYNVQLKISNNCGSTDSTFVLDVNVIGIQENESQSLKIYPNPSNGQFTLQLNSLQDQVLEIVLMDLQGRELKRDKKQTQDGRVDLDYSNLPYGIYMLKATLGNGKTEINKIIIQ